MVKPYIIKRNIKIALMAVWQCILKMYHRLKGRQVVNLLHIGKTGGTAFKTAIRSRQVTPTHFILSHRHRTRLWHIPRGEKVVFFVRDPIDRFVSGFYSRQRKGQPLSYNEWTPGEAKAFSLFKTPNELALALASPDHPNHPDALEAMKHIDHVNAPLSNWFKSKDYFNERLADILFIGRQETLNNDFNQLKSMLNISDAAQLPSDPLKAHSNPENLDKKLDKASIDILYDWYKDDFEFIKFCEEKGLVKPLTTAPSSQAATGS